VTSTKTSLPGLSEVAAFFGCAPPDGTVGPVMLGLSCSMSAFNNGDASPGIGLLCCDSSTQTVWWPPQ